MDDFEIGSRHTIWVNPFCEDVEAVVVSYTCHGDPIMRTVPDKVTLLPEEYAFPLPHEKVALERLEEVFREVHGEDL